MLHVKLFAEPPAESVAVCPAHIGPLLLVVIEGAKVLLITTTVDVFDAHPLVLPVKE